MTTAPQRKSSKPRKRKERNPSKTPRGLKFRDPEFKLQRIDGPMKPEHEEDILRAIGNGMLQTEIAKAIGKDHFTLCRYLAEEGRQGRVDEVRRITATYWQERAEEEIRAVKTRDPAAMFRARELAHHYRWRASRFDPRRYGDKVMPAIAVLPPEAQMAEIGTDGARALFAAVAAAIGLQVTAAPLKEGRILEHEQGDGAVTDGA